jgi:hypothetical protein
METKQAIAIEIGLQTQVLKSCPAHRQIYLDDDMNPAGAFALAIELVRKYRRYEEEFHGDEHELTDLLSDTLGTIPISCPECSAASVQPAPMLEALRDRGGFAQSAFESR